MKKHTTESQTLESALTQKLILPEPESTKLCCFKNINNLMSPVTEDLFTHINNKVNDG